MSERKRKAPLDSKLFYKKGFIVIKRNVGQSIKIGNDIEIVVSNSSKDVAYLAIKAPGKEVLRTEIIKEVKSEN